MKIAQSFLNEEIAFFVLMEFLIGNEVSHGKRHTGSFYGVKDIIHIIIKLHTVRPHITSSILYMNISAIYQNNFLHFDRICIVCKKNCIFWVTLIKYRTHFIGCLCWFMYVMELFFTYDFYAIYSGSLLRHFVLTIQFCSLSFLIINMVLKHSSLNV